ncbi:SDR family oxidoreductase [Kitasatospora sp. NBC_01287]|uniref:SDR family NAD(P)-dependent oxidoreductase n=1 Tax=Kitasatospora sp. NBC_01287 TaxID=2903573 RepID=UPI00224F93F6|nr:SDR family NAD(P)-dependent oxidoreductase [Kitasatospora sp. NBC_01287]MCX4747738.1 SDR family oxidoreductase [Kitasatospora sp. NBC_01287]
MSQSPTRVAVIAGAGNDIGLAVARKLAGHGYRIAVVDRTEALCYRTLEAVSAAGGQAQVFPGDVRLIHEAEAVMTRIAEQLGEPSVLVNNTSQLPDFAPSSLPGAEEDWDGTLRAGLRAPYLLSAAARRYLVGQGWGRIVNVARPQAGGERGDLAAAAATDGVRGLTRALAVDLGPHGVTVNAVLPGLIATDSARTAADCLGVSFEDARKDVLERIPLGRPGTPEEVADAVWFFASEAADYVSGQVLHVAGGPVA